VKSFQAAIVVGVLMVVVVLLSLCPAMRMSTIAPTKQGGRQRRRRRRGGVGGGGRTMTTTTMTTIIWMGGEGRGRGRDKDDETTTIICDMGNIRAYLLAMMMGGTTTMAFPSSRHWISARQPTTFSPWPYCHRPSRRCCHHHRKGRWRRW
jgi:hypothetical protein